VAMWAVPRAVGDWVYDRVANNRYSILGRRDECRFGVDEDDDRFLA
jgi:predicted DCC family thiol-disulfide oxidoreductase YuxK